MLEFSILTIGSFVTLLDSITIYIGQTCFKKNIRRIIPIFSLVYGLTLGIAGYFTPNVAMGANIIEAIFIGLSAGAAATGVNQVGKQLGKSESDEMSSIILELKKFIDGVEVVSDDINSETPCDGYGTEDESETIDESESDAPEEVVPSTEEANDYGEDE
jgi:hypothetical protein